MHNPHKVTCTKIVLSFGTRWMDAPFQIPHLYREPAGFFSFPHSAFPLWRSVNVLGWPGYGAAVAHNRWQSLKAFELCMEVHLYELMWLSWQQPQFYKLPFCFSAHKAAPRQEADPGGLPGSRNVPYNLLSSIKYTIDGTAGHVTTLSESKSIQTIVGNGCMAQLDWWRHKMTVGKPSSLHTPSACSQPTNDAGE